jgi:hypothetical protein
MDSTGRGSRIRKPRTAYRAVEPYKKNEVEEVEEKDERHYRIAD